MSATDHQRLRLLAVSTSRADLSRLAPILQRLAADPCFRVELAMGGYHWVDPAAISRVEAVASGVPIVASLAAAQPGEPPWQVAGQLTRELGDFLQRDPIDCLLVLGDRHEMLGCAWAALYHRVPVVHIGGGYTTAGAIDDLVRHAITRLSAWHLVANGACAGQVQRLGIQPERIVIVGAPDLDVVRTTATITREELLPPLGLDPGRPFLLVTIHPETATPPSPASVAEVFEALGADPRQLLVTAPADEAGAEHIHACVRRLLATRRDAVYHHTLGALRYVNAMRQADAVVGNSSSGLIEASLLPVAVVDIGGRQAGRERGGRVHHAEWSGESMAAALAAAVSGTDTPVSESPYGDGHTAERVHLFFHRLRQPGALDAGQLEARAS